MNDQPNSSQFRAFGAPPTPPTGPSRLAAFTRMAMTGGFLVALGLYGAQLLLPEDLKPSVVAGRAAGLTVRSETEAMAAVKLDYERRLADATAQANAKAQLDVAVATKVLEERSQGLAVQDGLAGFGDALCLGSMFVGALGTQNTGADMHKGAADLAKASCGVGDQIRNNVTQSQIEAVRAATGARGAPMSNGAVQTASTPVVPQRALDAIDAVTRPTRHYDYETEVEKVDKWATQFPDTVQHHLRANLPNNSTGWDLFVERARALDAAINHT